MIEVLDLHKRYRHVKAVDGLSFTAKPGEVTGFLGPNGAGKTTTIDMILGLAQPDGGEARITGKPFRELENPASTVGAVLAGGAPRGRACTRPQPRRGCPRAGSVRCSRRSGSATRQTATSAPTRSGCASGSPSPRRCSATPTS